MPFKIICSCGVALLAGDDLSNLKVACPECGIYTTLPDVPDPYKLPTNAEMVPLEIEEPEEEEQQGSRGKVKAATVRRKSGEPRNRGGMARPQGPKEMTNTEIILIISCALVGMAILIFLAFNV